MGAGAFLPILGVAAARKRRAIVSRFRQHQATAPERATSLEAIGLSATPLLRIQVKKGVLIEAAPGSYFLDEVTEARQSRIRRAVLLSVLVLGLLAVLLLA